MIVRKKTKKVRRLLLGGNLRKSFKEKKVPHPRVFNLFPKLINKKIILCLRSPSFRQLNVLKSTSFKTPLLKNSGSLKLLTRLKDKKSLKTHCSLKFNLILLCQTFRMIHFKKKKKKSSKSK